MEVKIIGNLRADIWRGQELMLMHLYQAFDLQKSILPVK